MKDTFIFDLQEKLKQPLPGIVAQHKMAHKVRASYMPPPENARKAAVMCLFYEKDKEPYISFIVRTSKNPNDRHGGQISFPGGKWEETDKNFEETACRETEEEIGIKAHDIKVLGKLTPLYIPVSNFMVYPFVGYLNYVPTFDLQEEEVDEILEIPFSMFKEEGVRQFTEMSFGENIRLKNVPYFNLDGKVLWGATAMIMSELLEV